MRQKSDVSCFSLNTEGLTIKSISEINGDFSKRSSHDRETYYNRTVYLISLKFSLKNVSS
jgi:hypothetical protein